MRGAGRVSDSCSLQIQRKIILPVSLRRCLVKDAGFYVSVNTFYFNMSTSFFTEGMRNNVQQYITCNGSQQRGILYHSNCPCTAVSVLYQALGSVCSPALWTPPVSCHWDARADLSLLYISPYYISRPCLSVSAILILCCRFKQLFLTKTELKSQCYR